MIGRDDLLVVRGRAAARPDPHADHSREWAIKTSPQPSTICNSQPLSVPKFQIRLHKKDDDRFRRRVNVQTISNVTGHSTVTKNWKHNIMKRLSLVLVGVGCMLF